MDATAPRVPARARNRRSPARAAIACHCGICDLKGLCRYIKKPAWSVQKASSGEASSVAKKSRPRRPTSGGSRRRLHRTSPAKGRVHELEQSPRIRWRKGCLRKSLGSISGSAAAARFAVPRPLGQSSPCLRSINIRWPFAQLILARAKLFECRAYHSDRRIHPHERLWLVQTPGRARDRLGALMDGVAIDENRARSCVVGVVWFGECAQYVDAPTFRADGNVHRIRPGSEFDWDGRGQMFAWRIEGAVALEKAVPAANRFPADIFGWREPRSIGSIGPAVWAQVSCEL